MRKHARGVPPGKSVDGEVQLNVASGDHVHDRRNKHSGHGAADTGQGGQACRLSEQGRKHIRTLGKGWKAIPRRSGRAQALQQQALIPAIKAEMPLIQSAASDDWWEGVSVPMLEVVRRRLRALVKLIPKGQKKIVYTYFEDELGDAATVDLPQVTAGLNMARFKDKARVFLRAHDSHLSLQRLRRNQPLTAADLQELERMLVEAGGSPELIVEVKTKSAGLGVFIRSLVGLDREAAVQLFSEFVGGITATPDQIEFIDLIVDELTQNGAMEPDRLFQSPFTDLNAQGPLGVFPQTKVAKIVDVLRMVEQRAAACA